MKIRPVGVELFHVDRQTDGETDMTKLIVASRNIATALKNPLRYSGNMKVVPLHLYMTYDVGDAIPEHTRAYQLRRIFSKER